MTYAEGNGDLIGDQIPVDLVVDLIIIACAFTANRKDFFVSHLFYLYCFCQKGES
jgi:hypothetical protein